MIQTSLKKFFNTTKNSNNLLESDKKHSGSVQDKFYTEILTQHCNKESCVNEKSNLKKKINDMKKKNNQIEIAIKTCATIIEKKKTEIDILQKTLKSTEFNLIGTKEPAEKVIEPKEKKSKVIQAEGSQLSFTKFFEYFNELELAEIRSIGCSPREDSKFITLCLKAIYKGRLECLKNKSVSGRGRTKNESKEKLTPSKMPIIQEMFTERINIVTNIDSERSNRLKVLNKLIKDGISNINRSNTKATEIDACCRLKNDFDMLINE